MFYSCGQGQLVKHSTVSLLENTECWAAFKIFGLHLLFVMESVVYFMDTCSCCQKTTQSLLWRSSIMFIHLQELARGIKLLSWYHFYFLKSGRVNTGLGWFGACGMLKYTFPWHMWSRKRKLLKGFSGKCIVWGPWRMHFPVSLQFFSLIKEKKKFWLILPHIDAC